MIIASGASTSATAGAAARAPACVDRGQDHEVAGRGGGQQYGGQPELRNGRSMWWRVEHARPRAEEAQRGERMANEYSPARVP